MAFIGNTPTTQAFTPAVDYFSGNGSTTAFTLSRPVASVAQVQVVIDNVAQNPSSAYTVSANTITFTSAPLSGTNNIYVYYTSPITQVIAPGQGTVNATSFASSTGSGAVVLATSPTITTPVISSLSSASATALTLQSAGTTAITIDTSQNVGIGTASPSTYGKVVSYGSFPATGGGYSGMSVIDTTSGSGLTNIFSGSNYTDADFFVKVTQVGASSKYALLGPSTNIPLAFMTNNTERMRIDSSGNVGIGVTPSAWSGGKALQIGARTSFADAYSSSTYIGNNWFTDGGNKYIATAPATLYALTTSGQHQWFNAPSGTAGNTINFTQAMTLDASGNLLVGKTASAATTVGFQVDGTGSLYSTMAASANTTSTLNVYSTGAANYRFYVGMGGTVYATSTTITGISDVRLKENIRDLDDGLDVVMALKPRKFDWKEGKGADIKNARGFIAQEFETVLPDMIEEWRDPAPEGEEPYKAINANLIPTLVKAIQELKAINDTQAETINALQADVTALKAKVA